jgi:hypothetical protein
MDRENPKSGKTLVGVSADHIANGDAWPIKGDSVPSVKDSFL